MVTFTKPINLFYQEPDPDRWLRYDRYPRSIFRHLLRGKPRPGGQKLVFLNLVKGLEQIGIPYRINDFHYAHRHPEEPVCIIGKPQVLFEHKWKNPVLFGASVFSHPLECPDLFDRYPVKLVLVPGEWVRQMFEPFYGRRVIAWPVGIDTVEWAPQSLAKSVDIVIYNKVLWQHDMHEETLLRPIREKLRQSGLSFEEIRYGSYTPQDLKLALACCRAAIFLCEHESQGLAYQQILASGVPIFAWNQGGYWKDPAFYPQRIKFGPVSSVPYWDERCGMKFVDYEDFHKSFDIFWDNIKRECYVPREYILENLTLEKCAQRYLEISRNLQE
ncbi:glycosyltransferase [soil metagenome]